MSCGRIANASMIGRLHISFSITTQCAGYNENMTKRQARTWGKGLFLLGLFVVVIGSPLGWLLFLCLPRSSLLWFKNEVNLFVVPGIGFALILLSFASLAYGSRVGDEQ